MKIASFFSGIGGLELGLEAALGAETVFQCESDPYARSVLARHWPLAQRHDDITRLQPDEIPAADVWCGGFPCQDISVAGKREGIRGARSGLFFEWMRLVRAVRPRFVVMENVPAILADENIGPVLWALAEAGYDAEWDMLGAWEVGAPHVRDRWWLVAWSLAADANSVRPQGQREATLGTWREQQLEGLVQDQLRLCVPAGRIGGVADRAPHRKHRLKCLGNAVVPQVAYVIGLRLRKIIHA